MAAPNQSAWNRRFRRLSYFLGAAGTFYLISSYALDRMKEARIRALKDRKDKDLLKSHFSTLCSTLSFTLYALLPTLSPQLDLAFPVEQTSQALQGLSNPASSQISNASHDNEADQAQSQGNILDSSVPDIPHHEEFDRRDSSAGGGSVSESWASEFRGRENGEDGGESFLIETDDGLSSATSHPISLPPTDLSTSSGSPPSDMMTNSQLYSPESLPRHRDPSPPALRDLGGKSKKELWRDLKVQSISRAITTAYLLPLLYILTTSQLSTLARERYLSDVKASLPPSPITPEVKEEYSGISGFIAESASLLPNPFALLPRFVASRLPFSTPARNSFEQEETRELTRLLAQEKEEEEASEKADAERMYLTYSWWVLHEGWRVIARRVESGVERVVGPMGLKRELSVDDWEDVIRDIRRYVDHDEETNKPFDFTPYLIPSYPLPPTTSNSPCPISPAPPSQHLQHLLSQSRTHLSSPDATYLIQGGVSAVIRNLLASLSDDINSSSGTEGRFRGFEVDEPRQIDLIQKKRLAESLLVFTRWGKGVWEGVPDSGVETLLSMGEFEGFAGLIFGDWA